MAHIYLGNPTLYSPRWERSFLFTDAFGIVIHNATWHDYRKAAQLFGCLSLRITAYATGLINDRLNA